MRKLLLNLTFVLLCISQKSMAFLLVTDLGFSPSAITNGTPEFSGVTYAGGSTYYAVGDRTFDVHEITMALNTATGELTAAGVTGSPLVLDMGVDTEAIRLLANGNYLVSDENGAARSAIREYSPVNGSVIASVSVPAIFDAAEPNGGFEGLATNADGTESWAINEKKLVGIDGPSVSATNGEWLRLQHFSSGYVADYQYAYALEPLDGTFLTGLTELLLMPTGELLSLERQLGFANGALFYDILLFIINTSNATDVSGYNTLADGTFTEVQKRLLWSGKLPSNYEAMTLGPELNDGSDSLLLVSEGGPLAGDPNNNAQVKVLSIAPGC
ncbi:MAG: esterase-like activity of phytase family protein [Halioglobus sp.]